MTSLLALIIRVVLLVVFTFGFVVLFEHGVANYPANATQDFHDFVDFAQTKVPPSVHLPFGNPKS